jgi:phosphocarrier protein
VLLALDALATIFSPALRDMEERRVLIVNKLGLHARAAARFVQLAASFECQITVARDGREVNGKSIMGVMMLAAHRGSEIAISASGSDEYEAVRRLEALICDRFGEGE